MVPQDQDFDLPYQQALYKIAGTCTTSGFKGPICVQHLSVLFKFYKLDFSQSTIQSKTKYII